MPWVMFQYYCQQFRHIFHNNTSYVVLEYRRKISFLMLDESQSRITRHHQPEISSHVGKILDAKTWKLDIARFQGIRKFSPAKTCKYCSGAVSVSNCNSFTICFFLLSSVSKLVIQDTIYLTKLLASFSINLKSLL